MIQLIMPAKQPSTRNLWTLSVLCMLRLRQMHPYEMLRLLRDWKKDEFLDLKRGSLYHAIGRLQRTGLIEVAETSREGKRPERTVYRLTADGEEEVVTRLRGLLARPQREATPFFAALSFVGHLTPQDAATQLEVRVGLLEAAVAALSGVLTAMTPRIGRLVLVEVEYARALRQAELVWVRSLAEDVRAARLVWDPDAVRCGFGGKGNDPGPRPADTGGES